MKRSDVSGFEVLPKRWICRKDVAWISRTRRLARDFERYAMTVAAFVRLAMIRIMLRQLAANASSEASRCWLLQLPRSAHEQTRTRDLPSRDHQRLVVDTPSPQPKGGLTWARMRKLAADWLPTPRILHPWPNQRSPFGTQGSRMRENRMYGSVRGARGNSRPYRDVMWKRSLHVGSNWRIVAH